MKSIKHSPGFEAMTDEEKNSESSEEDKRDFEKNFYHELKKKVPPPQPLIAKQPYNDVEPLQAGIDAHFLKVQQFSTKETNKISLTSNEAPSQSKLNEEPQYGDISLGTEIQRMITQYKLVYERIFPNSLPHSQREDYFLTEVANIKSLISKNLKMDSEYNIRMQVKNFRTNSKPEANDNPFEENKDDATLGFESRFETGNLCLAFKVSDNEYNLFLQNDINTQGHTQWFFFKAFNTKEGQRIKFNIMNFAKPDALYNYGMKILIFSHKKHQMDDEGWHRDGEDIKYFPNKICKNEESTKSLYTLTFTYKFKYNNDIVFFAYSFPYSYSDLVEYLDKLEMDEKKLEFVTRRLLCRTLAGNKCEYLTISSSKSANKNKKCVVLTARVHPGESVGSWMMHGAMDFLTSLDDPEAILLRENFVFKLIPMLNPDGVINGNYRCSLAGCDLNRRWDKPSKMIHPSIYQSKKSIKLWHYERGVVFFCDFHGHSKKKNTFMYGCNDEDEPEKTRVFPYMLEQICPFFSFKDSKFGNQKSKERTSRMTLWKELNIPNVFTCEASFCGCDFGEYANLHYTTANLMQIGKDICRNLLYYFEITPNSIIRLAGHQSENKEEKSEKKEEVKKNSKEYSEDSNQSFKSKIIDQLKQKKDLITIGEGSSSGSDDCPSEDNLQPNIIKHLLPHLRKGSAKKLKMKDVFANTFGLNMKKEKKNLEEKKPQSEKKPNKKDPPLVHRPFKPEKKIEERKEVVKEETKEEKKEKLKVETADKATQTEPIDFQKARSKYVMNKYGHSKEYKTISKAPALTLQGTYTKKQEMGKTIENPNSNKVPTNSKQEKSNNLVVPNQKTNNNHQNLTQLNKLKK